MSKSKYVRTVRWKLPRHRRSVRLPGSEEDRGRYIKCWNCGFVVDLSKNLGNSGASGIQVTDFPNPTDTAFVGGECFAQWKYPFRLGSVGKNGLTGGVDTYQYTPRKAEAVSGCPLCGCTNLP